MELSQKQKYFLYFIIFSIIILRLVSLGIYDLSDSTESRYASIAMRMILTNDWITPKYFDQPFWAKPPLSFWATAISFKLFGFNEFSARLPHFLIMIFLSLYVFLTFKKTSRDYALVLSAIFISSVMWSVLAGTVMTEACLVFGLSLMMLSFYEVEILQNDNRKIGYLFFIGLGICMLAKGPIGLVISGLSVSYFMIRKYGFIEAIKEFWDRMPVFTGLILASLICVPWYFLAEQKTPGFLNYFIVGEHFNRFLVSGWKGDRYGHAHSEPIGIIWLFFLLMILPWSLFLIYKLPKFFKETLPNFINDLKNSKQKNQSVVTQKTDNNSNSISTPEPKNESTIQQNLNLKNDSKDDFIRFLKEDSNAYFLSWIITPLLFFTFARNIIIPYASLSVLPFSIILTSYFFRKNLEISKIIGSIFLIPVVLLTIFLIKDGDFGKKSDKNIIKLFSKSGKKILATYNYDPRFSTYFYSRDKIKFLKDKRELIGCRNCFILIENTFEEKELQKIRKLAESKNSVLVIADQLR